MNGMDRKVGDYEWRQVSMWDSAPNDCIEKCIIVESTLSGKCACHFYLKRITVISDIHWESETVTTLESIPNEVLNWRNNDYRQKRV
tara:strand:- start:1580 stop:1840 length:261 start_codon:yes stop_codon:yes gene_type:complete